MKDPQASPHLSFAAEALGKATEPPAWLGWASTQAPRQLVGGFFLGVWVSGEQLFAGQEAEPKSLSWFSIGALALGEEARADLGVVTVGTSSKRIFRLSLSLFLLICFY